MTLADQVMPKLGMGTFRLEGETAYQSVKMALEVGFRHLDTAQIYGNEAEVGQAIADSGIDRSELFITTKVWNAQLNQKEFIDSVHTSLKKLQLDYIDLLLIHWPSPENGEPMHEYLTELKQAKESGLTRHIGLSNFTIANLTEAMQTLSMEDIFTNQVEVHPYLTNDKLRAFCQAQNIHITAYMPFAVGKVLKDSNIIELAEKYQVTPAEVVIAWELAHGMATIPSSTKRVNLEANFKASQLTLAAEDIQKIDQLNCGDRQAIPDFAPQWDE